MEIGIEPWPTDTGIPPDQLAREIEDRGFASMWLAEHTHVPTSRETPYPMQPGGDFPEYYAHMFDPIVGLAAAAAVTKRIALGTAIIVVAQRDPLILAKETACIDRLANGRFKLGVGNGWLFEEMRNFGVDPKLRWRIGREKVAAIKKLWTEDRVSFSGEYVQFSETWMWPKPVREPHPPILLGVSALRLSDVVAWGDGWIPVDSPTLATEEIPLLRRMAEEAGRDPTEIEVHVINVNHTFPATLDAYQAAGVNGVILHVPAGASGIEDGSMTLRILDRYVPLIEHYRD